MEVAPRCQALCTPGDLANREADSARACSTGVDSQAVILKVEKLAPAATSFPVAPAAHPGLPGLSAVTLILCSFWIKRN